MYVEAVREAAEILARPELNPTQGLKADIEQFVRYQLAHHNWTRASAESKKAVLDKFARSLEYPALPGISTDQVQNWCQRSLKLTHLGSK